MAKCGMIVCAWVQQHDRDRPINQRMILKFSKNWWILYKLKTRLGLLEALKHLSFVGEKNWTRSRKFFLPGSSSFKTRKKNYSVTSTSILDPVGICRHFCILSICWGQGAISKNWSHKKNCWGLTRTNNYDSNFYKVYDFKRINYFLNQTLNPNQFTAPIFFSSVVTM